MEADITGHMLLQLERGALDRWGKGDPCGYGEISVPEVTYFDPFTPRRRDGLDSLKEWYTPFVGKIRIDRDELLDPRVQIAGSAAILTFQYVSHGSEGAKKWNCTEVYGREAPDWRIVHTHWSFAAE